MRHLLINRADGGVSHMRILDPEADPANEVAKWAESNPTLSAVDWRLVELSELPPRRFRGAWKMALDGRVTVDLATARKIRLAELEAARKETIAELRDEIEAAEDDAPSRVPQLKAKRRTLRNADLAARVNAAADVDALERID